jgi:Zn-dependent protease
MALVAAAGPGANFVMGLGWMALWVILSYGLKLEQSDFFIQMCRAGIGVNSAMCVFNLIPLPPLDGGRIVTGILPMALARKYAQIERYGVYVFFGLIVLMQYGPLPEFLIGGMHILQSIFHVLVFPLTFLLS